MCCIARLYFRGGLVANEVGVLEGTTSTNVLEYGLHRAKVATRELAFAWFYVRIKPRQMFEVTKKSNIRKRVRKILK